MIDEQKLAQQIRTHAPGYTAALITCDELSLAERASVPEEWTSSAHVGGTAAVSTMCDFWNEVAPELHHTIDHLRRQGLDVRLMRHTPTDPTQSRIALVYILDDAQDVLAYELLFGSTPASEAGNLLPKSAGDLAEFVSTVHDGLSNDLGNGLARSDTWTTLDTVLRDDELQLLDPGVGRLPAVASLLEVAAAAGGLLAVDRSTGHAWEIAEGLLTLSDGGALEGLDQFFRFVLRSGGAI